MQEDRNTAVYYVRLGDPSQHLSYVQDIITRRSLNLPILSDRKGLHRASPFTVAKRIFKDEGKVTHAIREQERLVRQLISDRMRTARILARETPCLRVNESVDVGKGGLKKAHAAQNRCLSTDQSTYVETTSDAVRLPPIQAHPRRKQVKKQSKRLIKLNSIIAICGEESTGNSLYKHSLRSSQVSSRNDYSSFKGTLSVLEGLSEHTPGVVQELYSQRMTEEQENRIDSVIMAKETQAGK